MISKMIVEVIYALPERQYLCRVILKERTTVKKAIISSLLPELRKDIDLNKNKIGIYGHPARLDDIVQDGDRIEICRPITIDPKELRRQKVKKDRKIASSQRTCSLVQAKYKIFTKN